MNTSSCFSHNKNKLCSDTVSMQDGYWKIISQSLKGPACVKASMPVEFPEFNSYHSQVCPLGH